MVAVYLSLGSNLGDREGMLQQAINLLQKQGGSIAQASSLYETMPWGNTKQPNFINQVVLLYTTLSANALLDITQQIESELGKNKQESWGARTIDIDILYYGNQQIDEQALKVPHPYIQERNFVLVPLVEIAADLQHPVLQLSQQALLDKCPDSLGVKKLQPAIL